MSPAAYWASWADCLHMISQRTPAIQAQILNDLGSPNPLTSCSAEVVACANCLVNDGFTMDPGWERLSNGARPPAQQLREPGEWTHGWQFYAASCRDETARARLLLQPQVRRAIKPLMRSQSGPFAGRAFTVLPTSELTIIPAAELRILFLRRLHLPLPLSIRQCSCGNQLDEYGDHRCACSTCGVLRTRAKPLEKAIARVCREAGARVVENAFLRDMNLNGISNRDQRQIEVLAIGLPLWRGMQLAVDTTLVSPVRRNGMPQPGTENNDGCWLLEARRRKERKYHELLNSRRCRLVVVALEVGGRWSQEASQFIGLLSKAKARTAPRSMQAAVKAAFMHRWSGIIAVAAQRSLAASLLDIPMHDAAAVDGECPVLEDILADARLVEAEGPDR
jgi:hypothetical protein